MISKIKEKRFIKQTLTENGITLIALVVTIVVLLILASVSITAVFGDNGLLQLAKEAVEKTNEAVKNDKEQMEEMGDIINDYLEAPKTVEEAIKRNYAFKENTDIIDKYGNPITIPAGFRIVPNGTDFVEYNYDEDKNGSKTHIPTVQDGIVIEDAKGNEYGEKNQFVWIPVGEVNNKDGETTKIVLGRYEGNYMDEDLKQDANSYEIIDENTLINGLAQEYATQQINYHNEVAKNLSEFVINTNKKRGYWFARYEAVKGKDGKVKSQPSTKDSAVQIEEEITDGMVWGGTTQPEASSYSKNMYDLKNVNFQSDLVNSYAWDTAIVYIQKYSNNKNYAMQNSKNQGSPGRTGERTKETTDKVCNIYDMASNEREWTTETSFYKSGECILRGGLLWSTSGLTSSRWSDTSSNVGYDYSFRTILYLMK